MVPKERIEYIISVLKKTTRTFQKPAASEIIRLYGRDPFLILISCILSLRTKDTVSLPASIRLFQLAKTPEKLLKISLSEIEKAIYPCGFYRQKAQQIHCICRELIEKFDGIVPASREALLTLTGVGLKTANLVLSEGFEIPALCVDTHVHRIANRLGLVTTITPEQTEQALQKIIPKKYWRQLNTLLVMWGQNQCLPISPYCSTCPLNKECPKVDVTKKR